MKRTQVLHPTDPTIIPAADGRIGLREDGTLDEIVVRSPTCVHLEQMNDGDWWLGIDMPDGRQFRVELFTRWNARIVGYVEVDK